MGGGDGVEKVDGSYAPHGMVAVDVEQLATGAVEAVEPQEHRKGPGAQTSEDARGGGVIGAYGGTW